LSSVAIAQKQLNSKTIPHQLNNHAKFTPCRCQCTQCTLAHVSIKYMYQSKKSLAHVSIKEYNVLLHMYQSNKI